MAPSMKMIKNLKRGLSKPFDQLISSILLQQELATILAKVKPSLVISSAEKFIKANMSQAATALKTTVH